MKGLTLKQRSILDFIQNYIETHRHSPSYKDIMDHFSFSSSGSVYKYIRTLQRKGALVAEKKCSRSLTIAPPLSHPAKTSEVSLPFIGNVSLGYPIELFMQSQTLTAPAFLVPHPENTYVLRVQGNSLSGECILDGDFLLVEAKQDAQAGEMIIGLINQQDTFIKRYYPEGQYVRLEGNTHQPLILRSEYVSIQGIVVGLLRSY